MMGREMLETNERTRIGNQEHQKSLGRQEIAVDRHAARQRLPVDSRLEYA